MTSLKSNDFQKLASIHHLDTPVSNNRVKHLNKRHKSLKCINCNRPMPNSIIITVNFSGYSIIDTCHFHMQINKTT